MAETTTRTIAEWFNIQPNIAIKFYQHLRQLIINKFSSHELSGKVEADKSYFGAYEKLKKKKMLQEK